NEVHYRWSSTVDSQTGETVELRINRIEYTINAAAGLAAHARVWFSWGEPVRCHANAPPIGSRSHFHAATPRYSGYRPLASITTEVVDGAGGFRDVRRIDLTYADTTDMCAGQLPVKRLLTKVQETAYAPDGTATTVPPITCDYGGLPTLASTSSGVTGLGGERLLPTGKRWDHPFDATTENNRLMDINGDGRPDWVDGGLDTVCQLRWRPNLGRDVSGNLAFGSVQTISLPQNAWSYDEGGPPAGQQNCTLSGQYTRVHNENFPDIDQHWILYDFRDFDGDGFVDLLVGLSSNADTLEELQPWLTG